MEASKKPPHPQLGSLQGPQPRAGLDIAPVAAPPRPATLPPAAPSPPTPEPPATPAPVVNPPSSQPLPVKPLPEDVKAAAKKDAEAAGTAPPATPPHTKEQSNIPYGIIMLTVMIMLILGALAVLIYVQTKNSL